MPKRPTSRVTALHPIAADTAAGASASATDAATDALDASSRARRLETLSRQYRTGTLPIDPLIIAAVLLGQRRRGAT